MLLKSQEFTTLNDITPKNKQNKKDNKYINQKLEEGKKTKETYLPKTETKMIIKKFNNEKLLMENEGKKEHDRDLSESFQNMFNKTGFKFIKENNVEKDKKNIKKNENIIQKVKDYFKPKEENDVNFINDEFEYIKTIGKGEFGEIYLARWKRNNQCYAIKKEIFETRQELQISQDKLRIIKMFQDKTNCEGVIKIYGVIWKKEKKLFNFYILMESAEKDLENELIERSENMNYYKEKEIIDILGQLLSTCARLERHKIAHQDIKPQNILIIKGKYKLCDFGESKKLKKGGLIVEKISGTELYMSPIIFYGLRYGLKNIKHNTYKSDVFSLGLCIVLACTLNYEPVCKIRELTDIKDIQKIIIEYFAGRYSDAFINFLLKMLEIKEEKRPDFIQLEKDFEEQFVI